jgi:predicted esterase
MENTGNITRKEYYWKKLNSMKAYERVPLQAVQRGIRGTILAGERDNALLSEAKEINALFKEMNLEHRFIVIPGMGHSIPPNSTEHFQTAAAYILEK